MTAFVSKPNRFETCCSGMLTVQGTGGDKQEAIHYSSARLQRLHLVPRTRDEASPRPASWSERWGLPPRPRESASHAGAASFWEALIPPRVAPEDCREEEVCLELGP